MSFTGTARSFSSQRNARNVYFNTTGRITRYIKSGFDYQFLQLQEFFTINSIDCGDDIFSQLFTGTCPKICFLSIAWA